MAKILGIDLGTTNSAMAYIEGGEPKICEREVALGLYLGDGWL